MSVPKTDEKLNLIMETNSETGNGAESNSTTVTPTSALVIKPNKLLAAIVVVALAACFPITLFVQVVFWLLKKGATPINFVMTLWCGKTSEKQQISTAVASVPSTTNTSTNSSEATSSLEQSDGSSVTSELDANNINTTILPQASDNTEEKREIVPLIDVKENVKEKEIEEGIPQNSDNNTEEDSSVNVDANSTNYESVTLTSILGSESPVLDSSDKRNEKPPSDEHKQIDKSAAMHYIGSLKSKILNIPSTINRYSYIAALNGLIKAANEIKTICGRNNNSSGLINQNNSISPEDHGNIFAPCVEAYRMISNAINAGNDDDTNKHYLKGRNKLLDAIYRLPDALFIQLLTSSALGDNEILSTMLDKCDAYAISSILDRIKSVEKKLCDADFMGVVEHFMMGVADKIRNQDTTDKNEIKNILNGLMAVCIFFNKLNSDFLNNNPNLTKTIKTLCEANSVKNKLGK